MRFLLRSILLLWLLSIVLSEQHVYGVQAANDDYDGDNADNDDYDTSAKADLESSTRSSLFEGASRAAAKLKETNNEARATSDGLAAKPTTLSPTSTTTTGEPSAGGHDDNHRHLASSTSARPTSKPTNAAESAGKSNNEHAESGSGSEGLTSDEKLDIASVAAAAAAQAATAAMASYAGAKATSFTVAPKSGRQVAAKKRRTTEEPAKSRSALDEAKRSATSVPVNFLLNVMNITDSTAAPSSLDESQASSSTSLPTLTSEGDKLAADSRSGLSFSGKLNLQGPSLFQPFQSPLIEGSVKLNSNLLGVVPELIRKIFEPTELPDMSEPGSRSKSPTPYPIGSTTTKRPKTGGPTPYPDRNSTKPDMSTISPPTLPPPRTPRPAPTRYTTKIPEQTTSRPAPTRPAPTRPAPTRQPPTEPTTEIPEPSSSKPTTGIPGQSTPRPAPTRPTTAIPGPSSSKPTTEIPEPTTPRPAPTKPSNQKTSTQAPETRPPPTGLPPSTTTRPPPTKPQTSDQPEPTTPLPDRSCPPCTWETLFPQKNPCSNYDYDFMKDSDQVLAVVKTKKGGFKGRRINHKAMERIMNMSEQQKRELENERVIQVSADNSYVMPAGHYYFPRPVRFVGFISP